MKNEKFFLMDLERSIGLGKMVFWKKSRFGYAYFVEDAGEFSEEEADSIIAADRDKMTVKVPVEAVKNHIKAYS